MKTKIYSLLAVLMAVVCLTGCDDWTPGAQFEKNKGGVSFEAFDVTVSDNPTVVDPSSRAIPDLSDFLVTIYGEDGKIARYEGKNCEWTYGAMPEIVTLRVGKYSVKVRSHVPEPAAWDAPYFEGTESFEIAEGKITAIGTVTAAFSSVKVAVKFSELLTKNMSEDCKVTIVAGTGGSLVWGKNETRFGYFDVTGGAISLVATFEGTVKGSVQSKVQEFSDVAKGKYYILTYKMHSGDTTVPDESGDVDPAGITVKGDINEQDENGDVPGGNTGGDDGRPDDEDWGDEPGPGPDVPGPDDPKDNPITFDDSDSQMKLGEAGNKLIKGSEAIAKIIINAENGIEKLEVEIKGTDEFIDILNGVHMSTYFDLANVAPEDVETYEGLGLPVNETVKGQKSVTFDVSTFMQLLIYPGEQKFVLKVTDKEGNTKQDVLKINVVE